MAGVVGGLGCAGCGAGGDAVGECLDLGEGEELVAHVGVGVCYWVVGGVDCAAEFHWALEAGLGGWGGGFVVAI
jgi:hypothetical protein